ncbi:MAG: SMC family ATPase, partial [Acidimicrobiales bacterium]|nr:SMC family ATPase [Acidimicrobiales bacterium]
PGKVEARVALEFSVGGEPYTAVRVVRAGKAGRATTREARLEHRGRGEVLAGSADELTEQVTRLLGLSFEHFTTCVVLPQGKFQQFLHQTPKERQGLLVELLDLGIYGRMHSLANARARGAAEEAKWVKRELEDLAFATPEARGQLLDRVKQLEALVAELDKAAPRLTELEDEVRKFRGQLEDANECIARLASLSVPAGVEELSAELDRATEELASAEEAEQAASAAVQEAEAALDGLPSRSALETLLRLHHERAKQAARLPAGEAELSQALAREKEAIRQRDLAREAWELAKAALDAAQLADHARAVAARLSVGDDCPVCGQTIQELLPHETADLETAIEQVEVTSAALDEAENVVVSARSYRERCETLLEQVRAQVAALDDELAGGPDEGATEQLLAESTHAEQVLAERRKAERSAQQARREAFATRRSAEERERAARQEFESARDRVAVLEPPAPAHKSLLDDWTELVAWARSQIPVYEREAAKLETEAAAAAAERDELRRELITRCEEAGLSVRANPRDDVVAAKSDAEADLASIEAAMVKADKLRNRLTELERDQKLSSELAKHLGARGFQEWVLGEALERLVVGATEILYDLSGGAFSLAIDHGNRAFQVIDHANADTMRSARTLSGGETFLASLALALSLADQVAEMAAGGSARLESIFLDEGFGTLDPDTLGVVTAAIEELGSRGRMVGIVSHVRELAEAIPVRFDVVKGPHTSTVSRVDH